jgi:hypothetical protein
LEFVRRDYSDEIPFEVLMDLYDDDENTWCRLAIYLLHFEIHHVQTKPCDLSMRRV